MSSELYILVPTVRKWNQTILTITRPFTPRLWIAIFIACVLIGAAIGFLEYRAQNPAFYNVPFYRKLFMVIWFPVSKTFFQEKEGNELNGGSKVVLVVWLMTIFIIMQIFTASLSSWLTLNQLQPNVPKEYKQVGYQDGSYVIDFINDPMQSYLNIKYTRPLKSVEEYKEALDDGIVNAIFDEEPYIDIFLARYPDTYMKVGPISDEPGLAFAFRRESPIQQNFSNAVVKVTERQDMAKIKKTFKIGITPPTTQPVDHSVPQSLDVHSFLLLFIFMSVTTIMAIIISEITRRVPAKY